MKVEELNVDEKIGNVKDILTETQKKRGFLFMHFRAYKKNTIISPEDVLKALSKKLDIPLVEVYSTATFYKHFYFKPRGKNIVCVCTGTACHVRGSGKVA